MLYSDLFTQSLKRFHTAWDFTLTKSPYLVLTISLSLLFSVTLLSYRYSGKIYVGDYNNQIQMRQELKERTREKLFWEYSLEEKKAKAEVMKIAWRWIMKGIGIPVRKMKRKQENGKRLWRFTPNGLILVSHVFNTFITFAIFLWI